MRYDRPTCAMDRGSRVPVERQTCWLAKPPYRFGPDSLNVWPEISKSMVGGIPLEIYRATWKRCRCVFA